MPRKYSTCFAASSGAEFDGTGIGWPSVKIAKNMVALYLSTVQ
jgi:hypothetical protein